MKRAKKLAKARMGRPPKPEGEVKAVVFTVRMTDAERDAIAAAAEREGKPLTQWAREVLLERARG